MIILIIKIKLFCSKLQHKEKGYLIKFCSISSFTKSKLPHKFKIEEYSFNKFSYKSLV